MSRLIMELVDKTARGYIVYCSDGIHSRKSVFIPNDIYNWYKNANIHESSNYTLDSYLSSMKVDILKAPSRMMIKFEGNIVVVHDKEFIKSTKIFCFQTFIDIKLIDGNGQVCSRNYRFLKNYDTRLKAFYFIDKYSAKFSNLYKKWFIEHNILYDGISNLEVFHGDILYESEYIFKTLDGTGTAVYTFNVVSVEKE